MQKFLMRDWSISLLHHRAKGRAGNREVSMAEQECEAFWEPMGSQESAKGGRRAMMQKFLMRDCSMRNKSA